MLSTVVVCLGLIAADAPPADRAAYEATAGRAKDAAAQVRLALWCESHGMTAERMKHLAAAVAADPSHALARGLMGLVSLNGKWERPDDIAREARDDPARRALMQEYLDRRSRTPRDRRRPVQARDVVRAERPEVAGGGPLPASHPAGPEERGGLEAPGLQEAGRPLDQAQGGRRREGPGAGAAAREPAMEADPGPVSRGPPEQGPGPAGRGRAGAGADQRARRRADGLGGPRPRRADVAEGGRAGARADRRRGGLAGPGAAGGLRRLAGGAPPGGRDAPPPRCARVRLDAHRHDPRADRVRGEAGAGPGQGGELLIKGQGSAPNLRRLYSPPAPQATAQPGDRITYDENGLPVAFRPESVGYVYMSGAQLLAMGGYGMTAQPTAQFKGQFINTLAHSGLSAAAQKVGNAIINNYESGISLAAANPMFSSNPLIRAAAMYPASRPLNSGSQITIQVASGEAIPVGQMALEAQKAAMVAEQQLENDVATLRDYNQSLHQINNRVLPVLNAVSGLDLGPKPIEWQKWFVNLVGYRLNQMQASEKSTMIEDVPLAYQPQPIPIGQMTVPLSLTRVSCFGAGTPVRTLTGMKPIEAIKVGDPVLTQSTKTGALAYRPVTTVHHNPPSKTFRVAMGGEAIVSSEFHRFWVAGRGWVMARDLKVGDRVRTLDGPSAVTAIEPGKVELVYNLDVAEDHDFFVGRGGALVHDNTLPDLREKPFDAVGPLTGASPSSPVGPRRSMLGR